MLDFPVMFLTSRNIEPDASFKQKAELIPTYANTPKFFFGRSDLCPLLGNFANLG